VYPTDIESAFSRLAGVRDSVVVGVERNGHTEVHAVLLLERNSSAAEIVRQVNQQLSPHQRVASWTVWPEDDFPRGSLLKPKRNLIQSRMQQLTATAPECAATVQPSLQDVLNTRDKRTRIRQLARLVMSDGTRPSSETQRVTVRDMGLTSLDTVELVAAIEELSGTLRSEAAVLEDMTLQDLRHLAHSPVGQQTTRALDRKSAPRWAEFTGLNPIRRFLNPVVVGTFARCRAAIEARGLHNLTDVHSPVVLMGLGHEHAFDVLLIYQALPHSLRRMLGVVASQCGIPVIPVRLSGNEHVDFALWKPRARVTVEFGKAVEGTAVDAFEDE
jgi:long-chain acyl-CoA synthetase